MQNKKYTMLYILLLFLSLILSSCKSENFTTNTLNHNPSYSEKDLVVHYIDVGQGDSILVQINNKNVLIDGGPQNSSEKVISYLKSQGVKNLDYIIATHPHEDHIGGLPEVIKKFSIGEFYAPKKTSTTKIFENMTKALTNKKEKINVAKSGMTLNLGSNVAVQILSPSVQEYEDINNYSAVVKVTYGSTKFLFMGDAEKIVENELLQKKVDISADVLKVAHHGSSSSSSKNFLDKVSAKYAVISCGLFNDYGHPHKETLDELKKNNIIIYRTDQNKDIVFLSDGNKLVKK